MNKNSFSVKRKRVFIFLPETKHFIFVTNSIHLLTKRQGVDDPGRTCRYGRRQVYFHAARRASVFLGQIRPHEAPELQIHRRRRQEVPL